MRLPLLTIALFLSACATTRPPPAPELSPTPWAAERDALPGGSLRLLQVAVTSAPGNLVVQGAPNRVVVLPVYVYVFEHPTQGLVLIDTGFGRRTAADTSDYPGKQMTKLLGLSMEPDAAAADRLPEIGRTPEDVAHVVVTHMHPDHIGGLSDFPGANLHLPTAEWESRLDGGALGKPDPSPFADHATVTQFTWTEEPLGTFSAHADLFGDGSLIAIHTPGHTAGHISVLVNLRGGSYLITGDTAWIGSHWQAPAMKSPLVRGLMEHDWKANWESQWRIRRFAADHPEVTVLAGHEPRNASHLPAWPDKAE